MKKRIIIISIFLLIMTFAINLIGCVDMSTFQKGQVVFIYKDANIQSDLTHTDILRISKIFDKKLLFNDFPACGFHESVSLRFDSGQVFCIARDGCGLIYWRNVDKYFKLSSSEIALLHDILKEYGVYFPCI